MISWEERPTEVANLLNPAFCSVILLEAVKGFKDTTNKSMPYPLIYLILPIILHKASREKLPKTISTKLYVWLGENKHLKINFSKRTRNLTSYTNEALIFAIKMGVLKINGQNEIDIGEKAIKKIKLDANIEANDCYKKAYFLGRWLSKAGDTSTIYIMWGICP